MRLATRSQPAALRRERGATLIEGLIAMLIFSIGILAILGLHALSLKNTTDAQFRSEAAYLANSVIARMRLHDPSAVVTDFSSPNGARYLQWLADLAAANAQLPGMADSPPTIVFNDRRVTVTIFWRAQSDSALRRHLVDSHLDQ